MVFILARISIRMDPIKKVVASATTFFQKHYFSNNTSSVNLCLMVLENKL